MKDLIIFGDSIAQGAFDGEHGGWPNQLAAHQYKKVEENGRKEVAVVFNLGISGDTSEGLRRRFKVELGLRLESPRETTVLIAIGTNDALVRVKDGSHQIEVEQYVKNVRECIDGAKEKGCAVVCVGLTAVDESKTDPLPWDSEWAGRNSEIEIYDNALKTLCEEVGILFIPAFDLFVHNPELLTDGDHPGTEGHRRIFERVKEYLAPTSLL